MFRPKHTEAPPIVLLSQSAGELHRKLPTAQRLPLPGEERDQPLPAVGSRDKNAPLHLPLGASVGHAPSGPRLLPAGGEMVHGEVAEQVGARQVVEHQRESLRVRLVPQQDPVQVPDPPSLAELVTLPAAGRKREKQINLNYT